MRVWTKALLGACFCLASAAAGAQAIYKWKDAGGKWVFGDRPPERSEQVKLGPAPKKSAVQGQDTLENAKAARLFPVVLYSNSCGEGCDRAMALLTERAIPFAVKDPSKSDHFEAFKKASPDALAPAMTVGEKALVPFNDLAWAAALDEAGYSPAPNGPKKASAQR